MLLKRIITGIALFIIFGIGIINSGPVLILLVMLLSVLCLHEMHTIRGINLFSFGYFSSQLLTLFITVSTTLKPFEFIWKSPLLFLAMFTMTFICLIELFNKQTKKEKNSSYSLCINTAIINLTFPYTILIRNGDFGFESCLLLLCVISSVDSAAYFTGKLAGKTKLSSLSPKKTIEGIIGGISTGIIMGIVSIVILKLQFSVYFCLVMILVLIAPVGDLYESMLKRNFNLKNSSEILPGHGGIFDRFDSYIFCFPIFYYLTILLNAL